jgi:uncharacterized membrane protein HdeD (DUF308 family)
VARSTRRLAAVAGVVLQLAGGVLIAFTIARSVWYPFWAAQASRAELARSWGGPSPVGATLVHWAVAVLVLAVGWLLFRLGHRWRRRSLHA